MRWDCVRDGCFNKMCRPKIGELEPMSLAGLKSWLSTWWRSGLPDAELSDYDLKHRQPGDNLQPLSAALRAGIEQAKQQR
jgi:hypothetical protein